MGAARLINSISMKRALAFYAEAEALGIASKIHCCECISREHTCPTGKDVYLTYDKALKALRIRPGRERNKAIYKCHICGHYHLTTKDGKGRRPIVYSRSREKDLVNHELLIFKDARTMKPGTKFTCRVLMNKAVQYFSCA